MRRSKSAPWLQSEYTATSGEQRDQRRADEEGEGEGQRRRARRLRSKGGSEGVRRRSDQEGHDERERCAEQRRAEAVRGARGRTSSRRDRRDAVSSYAIVPSRIIALGPLDPLRGDDRGTAPGRARRAVDHLLERGSGLDGPSASEP